MIVPGHILQAFIAPLTQCRAPTCELSRCIDSGALCCNLEMRLAGIRLKLQALTQCRQLQARPERVMAVWEPGPYGSRFKMSCCTLIHVHPPSLLGQHAVANRPDDGRHTCRHIELAQDIRNVKVHR